MEIINLYPAPKNIDIGNRTDNDPPVFEKVNLYKVPNSCISSFGYIIKNFKVLKQSISYRHRASVSIKNILTYSLLKKKISVENNCLSIANGWYMNYYHFTIECLPKLYLLRDHLENSTLVFPAEINRFHAQWFELLGIKNIRYIKENEMICAPKVITTSFTARDLNHHDVILPEFKAWVLSKIKNINAISFKKIFVGRKNPIYRKVLNIDQTKKKLNELGFVYLEMEDYSVEDQIKLFHNAEQIICVHGAALSNMCFSNSNTKVIDIIHEEFKQWCFLKMAIILEIDYSTFPCSGPKVHNLPNDMRNEDITVDISKLKNSILQWEQ